MCKNSQPTESITQWSIKHSLASGIVILMGSLLASCATRVPTGPYYEPIVTEAKGVWFYRQGDRVYVNFKYLEGCILRFAAGLADQTIEFSWDEFFCGSVTMQDGPFIFEDLDTGGLQKIDVVERTFAASGAPALPVDVAADLASTIPGFAAVPASMRRYVVSLDAERHFKGALPEEVSVRLPEVQVGEHRIYLPPFTLLRHEKAGASWLYVPASIQEPLASRPVGPRFGGGYQFKKPPDILYQKDSVIDISAAFMGTSSNVSVLSGAFYFHVFGDQTIRLADPHIAWRAPNDALETVLPVECTDWRLRRYTTAHLSERLGSLSEFNSSGSRDTDRYRSFRISIPGYQPKRFKVTLPRVEARGQEWTIHPIVFEYRSSGVDVHHWP